MKHSNPIILFLLIVAVAAAGALLYQRQTQIVTPQYEHTPEARIARLGTIILRTQMETLEENGRYMELRMQGASLLQNEQEEE